MCPVNALRLYLRSSWHIRTSSLFVNPRTLVPCPRARISHLIRRVVNLSQPNVYAMADDLRKFATVQAFFVNVVLIRFRTLVFGSQTMLLPPIIYL